jgi:inorganic pyrophosphatase
MKVNIFAGARRLASVAAALGVVGIVTGAALSRPYPTAKFSIAQYGATPSSVEGCGADDAYGSYETTTSDNKPAKILLCFRQSEMFGGTRMVTYMEMKSSEEESTAIETQRSDVRKALLNAEKVGATEDAGKLRAYLAKLDNGSAEYFKGLPADSAEVKKYMQQVADRLKRADSTQKVIDAAYRNDVVDVWKFAAMQVAVFLVGGFLAVTCIGWVVRGFMGIPLRED